MLNKILGYETIKYKCTFCNSDVHLYKFSDTNPKLEAVILATDKLFNITNIKNCKCGALQIANDRGLRKKESLKNLEFLYYYSYNSVYRFKKNNIHKDIFPKKENKYKKHIYKKAIAFLETINYDSDESADISGDYFYDFCYCDKFDDYEYQELFEDFISAIIANRQSG